MTDKYFYATVYRDFYNKLDSLPNTSECRRLKQFILDLCKLDKRNEEYNFILYWRGTKDNPNTVNRRLDQKYLEIDLLAEPDPSYYGFVEEVSQEELEKQYIEEHKNEYAPPIIGEDGKEYYDQNLMDKAKEYSTNSGIKYNVSKGNENVVGLVNYASDDQKKQILSKYQNSSGNSIEDKDAIEARKTQFKNLLHGNKEERKQARKDITKDTLTKLGNRNRIVKFIMTHFLILAKIFLILMLIWIILQIIIYVSGAVGSNFGQIPYALCVNDKEETKTQLYYVSLPSSIKQGFHNISNDLLANYRLKTNFDNFITEEESGISFKGSIKKDGKTEYPIPTSFRECKNCSYTANIQDLISKNKTNNTIGTVTDQIALPNRPTTATQNNISSAASSSSTATNNFSYSTPGSKPYLTTPPSTSNSSNNSSTNSSSSSNEVKYYAPAMSFGGGITVEQIAQDISDNPLNYAQKGKFKSREGSDMYIIMRWEYMDYTVDANGIVTSKTAKSSEDIRNYKNWLKKQKIIVFNPTSKKYVVLQPKIAEGDGTSDLVWGPDDTNYIAEISEGAAKILGFGGSDATMGNATTIENSYTQLGYYFVPEDTQVGSVSSVTGGNSVACSTRGMLASGDYQNWRQCDPQWGTDRLGGDDSSSSNTVCRAGCYVTSMSMMLAKFNAQLNISEPLTPASFNKYGNTLHYMNGGGMSQGSINNLSPNTKYAGLKSMKGMSREEKIKSMTELLANGYGVICQVKDPDQGDYWIDADGKRQDGSHYVLLDNIQNNIPMIADPGISVKTLGLTPMWSEDGGIYPMSHTRYCEYFTIG